MSRHQFTNIQLPLSLLFVHILLSNASCVCEHCIPFQYKFATVLCLFTSFFLRPFHPFGLCSTLLYCAIFPFYLYPVQLNWHVRVCVLCDYSQSQSHQIFLLHIHNWTYPFLFWNYFRFSRCCCWCCCCRCSPLIFFFHSSFDSFHLHSHIESNQLCFFTGSILVTSHQTHSHEVIHHHHHRQTNSHSIQCWTSDTAKEFPYFIASLSLFALVWCLKIANVEVATQTTTSTKKDSSLRL